MEILYPARYKGQVIQSLYSLGADVWLWDMDSHRLATWEMPATCSNSVIRIPYISMLPTQLSSWLLAALHAASCIIHDGSLRFFGHVIWVDLGHWCISSNTQSLDETSKKPIYYLTARASISQDYWGRGHKRRLRSGGSPPAGSRGGAPLDRSKVATIHNISIKIQQTTVVAVTG